MMEVLFRGQTRKFGEKVNMAGEKLPGNWVYGGAFQGDGDFSIIYGWKNPDNEVLDVNKHVVYSETLGQYTGAKDKHGNKIFEGDILHGYFEDCCEDCGYTEFYIYVEYRADHKHGCGFFLIDPMCPDDINILDTATAVEYEVIGNIHDIPEFLGEKP